MRPADEASSITALASELKRRIARASKTEMRGLLRTFSNSSSLRVIGNCWMLNESAPAWFRIAAFTDAFSPWMSDTTAMIDVTATMLPRTVMNDRSFALQIASSAMRADSQNWLFIAAPARLRPLLQRLFRLLRVQLHRVAVRHAAHRVVGTGDHLVAGLEARRDLEVAFARHAELDRQELGAVLPHHEHAFDFLARLSRLQLLGRRDRFDRRTAPFVDARLAHDLAVRVVDH